MDATGAGEVAAESIPTGFASLDRMLGGGFRRRDFIVLSGDIGSGKSSLALGIAVRSARQGTPITLLSGEMNEERLLERALALESRTTVDAIRAGQMDDAGRAAVGAAAIRLRDLPLQVRPLAGRGFQEVEQVLDAVPRRALLIVDYLQMMSAGPESSPDHGVAASARALKELAVGRDVAVLAVAQMPRHNARRRDPRPTLDDLGGLGALKQHADIVLSIYREEMYRPEGGVEGATELIIAKNRNGPTGFIDLYFYQKWLRFEDMLDPE